MLEQHGPALTLGHSTPDAELDAVVEGVGEALGDDRAPLADHFGVLLGRPPHEQGVGVDAHAPPFARPMLREGARGGVPVRPPCGALRAADSDASFQSWRWRSTYRSGWGLHVRVLAGPSFTDPVSLSGVILGIEAFRHPSLWLNTHGLRLPVIHGSLRAVAQSHPRTAVRTRLLEARPLHQGQRSSAVCEVRVL